MYGFHTFEKKLKDLQPPEKSGLQYKCLVVTLSIVYEGMNSSETSLKQFSLVIKMYYPLFEITLFLPYSKFSVLLDEKVSYVT